MLKRALLFRVHVFVAVFCLVYKLKAYTLTEQLFLGCASSCPSSTSLPSWLSQSQVGAADSTELESMALPSSDTNSIAIKEEALLHNFHIRFKKDFIYVRQSFLFI